MAHEDPFNFPGRVYHSVSMLLLGAIPNENLEHTLHIKRFMRELCGKTLRVKEVKVQDRIFKCLEPVE